ncbi:hypothetical protein SKAU_G00305630 [Synaphobranchus kaupii]|uniref:C2 domain-containing protein n=1 Tax=Synaphobranchus kaupii TaxID=118154 RepID=A0A9Q1EQJ5_SYNKA|nr:hypothetical protein SKAU_G00305630 [Synaphobranchus kaupii]
MKLVCHVPSRHYLIGRAGGYLDIAVDCLRLAQPRQPGLSDKQGAQRINTTPHKGRDMNFPTTLELSIGDIRMPFSDDVKYSILGISVLLLVTAIILLVWQVYRYFTQKAGSQDQVNSLLCREDRSTTEGNYGSNVQTPNMKLKSQAVERPDEDSCRLSQCLSPGSPSQEEQTQAQGSLCFSLLYDQLQARLVVTVLEARGLPERRRFRGSVDPSVRVRLLWAGPKDTPTSHQLKCVLREWQSRTVKDSANPTFGDQFSCSLPENDLPRVTVRLEVRDFNKYSRHEILGEVRTHLGGLSLCYPLEIQENLQPPKKDAVGAVLLSLKYLPIAQRLEVGLLKIRTLSRPPSKHTALYARTSVVCNRCNLRHQKTTMKTRWEMTVFNEVMTFALPDPQVTECTILVSVYEVGMGKRSSKRLIGQASLKKGKKAEEEQWSLMMRSLRQPIAKWHPLFI